MNLTAKIIRDAVSNNDAVLTAEVRSYSGRGMYGKECIGVTVEVLGDLVTLGAAIAYEIAIAGDGSETVDEAIEDLIGDGELAPAVDNMGMSYIAYWPSIPFEDTDDAQDGAIAGTYTAHGDGFGA